MGGGKGLRTYDGIFFELSEVLREGVSFLLASKSLLPVIGVLQLWSATEVVLVEHDQH